MGPSGANCAAPDFNTIQAGIDAVTTGGTVNVCSGNYDEDPVLDEDGLTLRGAQTGVDARDRSGADEAILDGTFAIIGNDGSVVGFTVENADSPVWGGVGIYMSGGTGDHRVANNIVRDNTIGVYPENDNGTTVVRQNQIENNNTPGPGGGNGIYTDFGISNVVIDENGFAGNDNADVLITGVSERNSDVEITDNDIADSRSIYVSLTDDVTIEDNSINSTDSGDGNGVFSAIVLAGDVNNALVKNNSVTGASTAVRVGAFFFSVPNTDIEAIGNTLVGNDFGIRVDDGGLSGDLQAHGNRIAGNGTGIQNGDNGEVIDATGNWFGCNEGPGNPACDTVVGTVDADDNLTLAIDRRGTKLKKGKKKVITASINGGDECLFPDGTAIDFTTTLGDIRKVKPTEDCIATAKLKATQNNGTATVSATLDNETQSVDVKFK